MVSPMRRRLTELELCQKYENESAHSEHVTHLALRLFDRTRKSLGLKESSRRLLESACRLHDIGYRDAGDRNHAGRSADMAQREGVSGLTPARRAVVAGAILLHSGARCRIPRKMELPGLDDMQEALQIGAFLRIADGLDHAHIQSAAISAIRKIRKRWRVIVRDSACDCNVTHAQLKSDLWRRVFGRALKIVKKRDEKAETIRFGSIVRGRDSAMETARKLICILFRTLADNVEGSMAGKDPCYLHDMRVALRRARAALRFFRRYLKGGKEKRLARNLRAVCDALGLARDSQVWLEFLEGKGRMDGNAAWNNYMAKQKRRNRASLRALRKLLTGGMFRALLREMAFFARIEILRLMRKRRHAGNLRRFAARKLCRAYGNLVSRRVNIARLDPVALHEFRKDCRRVRYAAEFAAPVLGEHVHELEGLMKTITDAIGNAHDMDVHLVAMEAGKESVPVPLALKISRQRSLELQKSIRAWDRIRHGHLRKRLLKRLFRAGGLSGRDEK